MCVGRRMPCLIWKYIEDENEDKRKIKQKCICFLFCKLFLGHKKILVKDKLTVPELPDAMYGCNKN